MDKHATDAQSPGRPVSGSQKIPGWKAAAGLVALGIAIAPTVVLAADGAATAEGVPTRWWEIILAGGATGVIIILILLALSLTAAYLVFDQLLTLRHNELIPSQLADKVRQLLVRGRAAEAEALLQQEPSLLSFVLQQGLAELDGGWPAVEKSLEDALAEQAARLMRRIEYLAVIGNIAPMLGLLGTVVGMIFAFQQVAATQGAAGAGELAEGIYQALVTTVGGLVVAIPSLAAFAIFRNRLDQLVAEAAYTVQHTCRPLKRRGSAPVSPATATAAPPSSQAAPGARAAAPATPPTPPPAKRRG